MPICLIPMDGSPPVPLDKAVMLFGRQTDCDVVLKSSRKVSRHHCCVAQIDGEFVVRDLGSMNGVRINGELIRSEGRLRIGDELFVGDIGYRLAAVDALPKRGAPPAVAPAGRRPLITPDPRFLSQDIPIALPDEDRDFEVEPTAPKLKAVSKPSKRGPKAQRDTDDSAADATSD